MNKARDKGIRFEQYLAKKFRENGYPECVCSRAESKTQDDLKVDLCFSGIWNVQAKNVERLGSIHKILDSMPKDSKVNVVFHKRARQGVTVSMTEEDFWTIVRLIND